MLSRSMTEWFPDSAPVLLNYKREALYLWPCCCLWIRFAHLPGAAALLPFLWHGSYHHCFTWAQWPIQILDNSSKGFPESLEWNLKSSHPLRACSCHVFMCMCVGMYYDFCINFHQNAWMCCWFYHHHRQSINRMQLWFEHHAALFLLQHLTLPMNY